MKKILLSVLTIGIVAALGTAATSAYFSDTEASRNNVLRAGAIDLLIDNESYYYGESEEVQLINTQTWTLKDLTIEKFFDFQDLKPGDWGEDTISAHINDNPAWLCANVTLTQSAENGRNEPELRAGDTDGGDWAGELGDELYFAFWIDDGDNVYESDEHILLDGSPADLPQEDGNRGSTFALADSQNRPALQPENTYYLGKYWCFGDATPAPVSQDGSGEQLSPVGGSGFICNGTEVGNMSQTDSLRADITFYAEQERHNPGFLCSSWNPNPEDIVFERVYNSGQNEINKAANHPYIDYTIDGDCIDFSFVNPTPYQFVFDYRIDGQDGYEHDYWDLIIHEGELITQQIGLGYNQVYTQGPETKTAHVCGQDEIWAGLREGAEQRWYLDWIKFEAE